MTYLQVGNNPLSFLAPPTGNGYFIPLPPRSVVYTVNNTDHSLYILNLVEGNLTPDGLPQPVGNLIRVGTVENYGIEDLSLWSLARITDILYATGSIGGLRNSGLFTLNENTGEATRIGGITNLDGGGVLSAPFGLATIDNTLYMAEVLPPSLWVINRSNGVSEKVGDFENAGIPQGLAVINNILYMVGNIGRGQNALFTVNTRTGLATRVGSAVNFGLPKVNVDPVLNPEGSFIIPGALTSIGDQLFMAASFNDTLYTLNTTTGEATVLVENIRSPISGRGVVLTGMTAVII